MVLGPLVPKGRIERAEPQDTHVRSWLDLGGRGVDGAEIVEG
jgi:hypothetical protein